ncbi:MAG: hypothetical protein FGM24_10340 [Candidatus Kapabacteria bacterium]|nr:hypothetical protein [Candidatus Kapabacteria bacterium]
MGSETVDTAHLRALTVEHKAVISLICMCALGPIALVLHRAAGAPNVVSVLPLFIFAAATLAMSWWVLRRFGADYLGGTAANTLLPMLTLFTVGSGLIVGSGMMFFPQAAPWLAIPAMPLMLGTIVLHDLGLRGIVHTWMQRTGFGRTMRVAVPVGLSLLLTMSADREGTFVLPLGFALGTFANGLMREHIPGTMYLLVTPPLLLFASWLLMF